MTNPTNTQAAGEELLPEALAEILYNNFWARNPKANAKEFSEQAEVIKTMWERIAADALVASRALPLPEQQVTEAMQPFIKRAAAFKDYNRSDDFTVSVRLGDLKALHRAAALSHKDSSNDTRAPYAKVMLGKLVEAAIRAKAPRHDTVGVDIDAETGTADDRLPGSASDWRASLPQSPSPQPVPAEATTPAHDEGHPHLIGGEFQSDKYPTTPRGKVPLSVKDKTAQDLLWIYAQRRRAVDAEFATDLETALLAQGFAPVPAEAGMVESAKAFVAKVEELTPDINGMFQIAKVHGASWPSDKNWVKELASLKEALASQPKPMPVAAGGWKMVPVEPTTEIVDAMCTTDADLPPDEDYADDFALAYRRAIAASPPPPSGEEGELRELATAIMGWARPHLKHDVSFNVLVEALEHHFWPSPKEPSQ